MKLIKTGVAGTLESSDALVTIEENPEKGIEIQLQSSVENQFGKQIRDVIKKTVLQLGIENANIRVIDKGALDCTIRARVLAASYRAAGSENYIWEVER